MFTSRVWGCPRCKTIEAAPATNFRVYRCAKCGRAKGRYEDPPLKVSIGDEYLGHDHYHHCDPDDGTMSWVVIALCRKKGGALKYHTAISDGMAWFDTNASSEERLDAVKWWKLPDLDTDCREGQTQGEDGRWDYE